ncbi:MAG: Nif3-like dinuclear metal center hexameric protein [Prevotellaceae bacterium]|jgi:dinuclear metal center YbgI/SA1388 family protein|nr:Nif3-like dinuclear metal center hexameric protein [Prevotellaceae bacterium]
MPKLKEITKILETFAPLGLQEDFDNSGLIFGDENAEIRGALLCIDITESVIDEAVSLGFNLIISHHPLIFSGLKKITGKTYIERCLIKAIENKIAIYAAHTNFDSVSNGVSYRMAEKIGLKNLKILVPKDDFENSGLGVVGELGNALNEKVFLQKIKQIFNVGAIKHSKFLEKNISKVALCGGSGAEFINDAKRCGADIYITADVSYHRFFEAENQLIIADIGHFESEQFTKEIFYEQLIKNFPNFAVKFSREEKNVISFS